MPFHNMETPPTPFNVWLLSLVGQRVTFITGSNKSAVVSGNGDTTHVFSAMLAIFDFLYFLYLNIYC